MSVFKNCNKCCSCCLCLNKKKDRQDSVVQAKIRAHESEEEVVCLEEWLKPLPKFLPLTFLPDIVVDKVASNHIRSVPFSASAQAVILMCDVCNFTCLTESYCEKGVTGIEELASIMNGYMSTLSGMMLYSDGDILSFAGDAFLVQWLLPEDEAERRETVCKAYSCALNLQAHPSLEQRNLDGKLRCKIGLAIGEVTTWVLGTWEQSLLFVVSGSGLSDVHTAEELCVAKDIVVSRAFFRALQEAGAETFTATELLNGYVKINDYRVKVQEDEKELVPIRVVKFQDCNDEHLAIAKTYLIPSIREVKTSEELSYLSEMTPVTILFISLPDVDVGNPTVLDKTFGIVLGSVSKQRGCINKMILFDKGCSFLVVFGLPGMKNPNDAARALICAHDIVVKHELLNLTITTGVASGTCYCGLVGHSQRQEYTVIGATVNLAARLMVVYSDDPIALDEDTFHLSRDILGDPCFHELPPRKLKGVSKKGKIYGCKIVNEKIKKAQSSVGNLLQQGEEGNGEEPFLRRVHDCLAVLVDPEERFLIHESTLLPVLVFETQGGSSANSYFTFVAARVARRLSLRVVSCCTYVATISNPFSTAAYMVMDMLRFSAQETASQKEEKLLAVIPRKWDEHLYLLNHILEVGFPYPRFVSVDKASRETVMFKIFLAIFNQYAEAGGSVVLAVDDVDSMDDCSWRLFQALVEGERFVLVLNIHPEFTQLTASVLVLKAHTHVDVRSHPHFASLACWHLGAHAVSRQLVNYLREKTAGDTQLLEEVVLLPAFTNATDLLRVDPRDFDPHGFHLSSLYAKEDNEKEILVCDLKPGYALQDLFIPPNINDAVQTALNHLSMQDRLLLKRAAVLGSVFDLHMLEAISTGLSSDEVVSSLNNLIGMHILCCTCTSPGMLYSIPPTPSAVIQHHLCLCSRIKTQSPFFDTRKPQGCVSAYQRLKFRSRAFREAILSYMTSEQFRKMHVEAVNDLETVGIICRSCKNRRLENLQEERFDMRAAPVQVNLQQCKCLKLRPHLFNRICFMYKKIGHHLLPAYYKKKAAQAANDLGYPIEGLIFIEKAENFLQENLENADQSGENVFDPVTLRASMYKTAAKSAILLRNYYYAAFFVEKALTILKMGTVWFYGLYTPHTFQRHLKKLSLLRSEAATKITDVLAESYVLAEKYELALNILKFEFVALTFYPIDFLQMLNYMILLYISLTHTQPEKEFRTLEKNLLATIRKRLQSNEVMLNLLEIRGMGKAYLCLMCNNTSKNNLSYAEEIGMKGMGFLTALKDEQNIPYVLVHLTELAIHQKNYEKGFQLIQKLSELSSCSNSVVYCQVGLSQLLMQKVEAEGKSHDDEEYVRALNEFVAPWADRRIFYFAKDEQLHATAHFALWALNSARLWGWSEAQAAFQKCYAACRRLLQAQECSSYFTVGGALAYLRVKILSKQAARDPHATMQELEKYKILIKRHFPVYLEKYQELKREIGELASEMRARDNQE